MKKKIFGRFFFLLACCYILTNCSSPIGDFGRIDASKALHITNVQTKTVDYKNKITYFNPINYSVVEKKFRLTAFFLKQIDYDISLIDKLAITNKTAFPEGTNPINGKALVNYFNAIGINSIEDRYQKLTHDLSQRSIHLDKFINLSQIVVSEDAARRQIYNQALDEAYVEAIRFRRRENLKTIEEIIFYMNRLYNSYQYVSDQGKIIEPTIITRYLKNKLKNFKQKINKLQTIY